MIASGIVFLLTIGSGIWLSKLGKPYNSLIFNLHKFIALGFIIYNFVIVKNLFKSIDVNGIMWLLIIVSMVSALTLIATGGILSIKDEIKDSWILVHKIASVILLVSSATWFYLGL